MNTLSPSISPRDYVLVIRERFSEAGDSAIAEGQMAYMRHRFPYYGLKAPQWVAILKEVFNTHGLYDGSKLRTFARRCFREEYHEMFYAGLQMMEKQVKKQSADFIDFLENAIITGDWWDTVDWINKLVGMHFLRYPNLQHSYAHKWIVSDNIWLQRVAIIHQLAYKDHTDHQLLFEMILKRKGSSEFFIQKGAGWALRQYARTDPGNVLRFLARHKDLPALTRREAMKHL